MQDYDDEDCGYSEPDYDYLQELAELSAEQDQERRIRKASEQKRLP